MIRHLSYIIPNKSSDLSQQIKADKIITIVTNNAKNNAKNFFISKMK